MLEFGRAQGIGFGVRGEYGWPPHTPALGLMHTGDDLNALNVNLFEGLVPGLLMVLLLFLAFTRNPVDWVLLASFAALPALNSFYWFHTLLDGPRVLHEGLAPILLLSARGLTVFPKFAGRVAGADAETRTRNVIAIIAAFSLVDTAVIGLPNQLRRYGSFFCGVDNRVLARVTERRISNAVVFTGTLNPERYQTYYGAQLLNNALDHYGRVVYARDRGVENYVLMHRFPGRAYYYADRDTFYRIADPESLRNAPEIRDIEQAGQFVRQKGTSGYRSVMLPYREIGAFVDTGAVPSRTFREVSYQLLRGLTVTADYLPAIAVFMPGDPRTYSSLFEPMRQRHDYDADGCRFTLLFSADSGKLVVYDLRSVGDDSSDTVP
jgi:hypothetical protein